MEHKINLYFSDLTYERQEKIKEELLADLNEDKELMAEIAKEVEDELKDEEITTDLAYHQKWGVISKLDNKVDEIINKTFYGEGQLDY